MRALIASPPIQVSWCASGLPLAAEQPPVPECGGGRERARSRLSPSGAVDCCSSSMLLESRVLPKQNIATPSALPSASVRLADPLPPLLPLRAQEKCLSVCALRHSENLDEEMYQLCVRYARRLRTLYASASDDFCRSLAMWRVFTFRWRTRNFYAFACTFCLRAPSSRRRWLTRVAAKEVVLLWFLILVQLSLLT